MVISPTATYTSNTLGESNDVAQGGVRSPFLFGIYIDEVLNARRKSSYGCHMGNIFVRVFAYAPDSDAVANRVMATGNVKGSS